MNSKGYVWFAFGKKYVELSSRLAESIKKVNRNNQVCVITDVTFALKHIDKVQLCEKPKGKFDKEWKVFELTPFTHTIKLEADMLFTQNTDWWWYHLHQFDMVHSYNCRNYKDDIVEHTAYRKLFKENSLPNIYSGLTYFRKSEFADKFYKLCKHITENWESVSQNCLKNCHDDEPTTDVVYALAKKISDPLDENKIKFDWFNFVHNKNNVNQLNPHYHNNDFLQTYKINDSVYLGGYRQSRVWHYHEKDTMEKLDARIF